MRGIPEILMFMWSFGALVTAVRSESRLQGSGSPWRFSVWVPLRVLLDTCTWVVVKNDGPFLGP